MLNYKFFDELSHDDAEAWLEGEADAAEDRREAEKCEQP